MTALIHHAANRGHGHPANSLSALKHCLEAGAQFIELDISPLADGHFLLFHSAELEDASDGRRIIAEMVSTEIEAIHYTLYGHRTAEPLALLEQAMEMITAYPALQELQLDLKPYASLTSNHFRLLEEVTAAHRERLRISSVADWLLRQLRQQIPSLKLGFDPLLYLDAISGVQEVRSSPPFRLGAYGYWDDHPLAWHRWGATGHYLRLRAETLMLLVPEDLCWFIRAELLAKTLGDDFDWIDWLHARGCAVAAWTLDANADQLPLARRLATAGVDRITTNDAPALASSITGEIIF